MDAVSLFCLSGVCHRAIPSRGPEEYGAVGMVRLGWWSGIVSRQLLSQRDGCRLTCHDLRSIYVTRTVLTAYFNFRLDALENKLKDQQTERATTIQSLKAATKYDSTLELLEKYGGEPRRPKKKGGPNEEDDEEQAARRKAHDGKGQGTPNRVNMAPPPTANIPRRDATSPVSQQGTPRHGSSSRQNTPGRQQREMLANMEASAEFAPNAFESSDNAATAAIPNAQYAQAANVNVGAESHWYDRVMDLLLGEDETAAKNRYVLICKRCRLVNGQAPPGTRTLSDVGQWKCMGCGAINGEIEEGKRIVQEVLANDARKEHGSSAKTDSDMSDAVEVAAEDVEEEAPTTKKRPGRGKK